MVLKARYRSCADVKIKTVSLKLLAAAPRALAAHLLADLAPAPIQKRCVPREGSVRGPENFTN